MTMGLRFPGLSDLASPVTVPSPSSPAGMTPTPASSPESGTTTRACRYACRRCAAMLCRHAMPHVRSRLCGLAASHATGLLMRLRHTVRGLSETCLPLPPPDVPALQAARRAAIEAARGAQRWGLVLGTLGRQVLLWGKAKRAAPAWPLAEVFSMPVPDSMVDGFVPVCGKLFCRCLAIPSLTHSLPLTTHYPSLPCPCLLYLIAGQPAYPRAAEEAVRAAGPAIRHGAAVG